MDQFHDRQKRDVILVVDDQPSNLKVIASVLSDKYSIRIANNGLNALKMLELSKPQLILLDVMMPEMDGFEVCREIKKNKQISDIPIIFLTAKTEVEDIMKGFDYGAVDYITKPFKAKEVMVRVKNHLDLYHSEQSLLRRDVILQALSYASELFLKKANWQDQIEDVLRNFSEALNINQVSVFQNSLSEEGALQLKLLNNYRKDTRVFDNYGSGENSKERSYHDYGFLEFLPSLEVNKPVFISTAEDTPVESFLQDMNIDSVIIIPIFVNDQFWGFITFGDNGFERSWHHIEIEALKLVGSIMGAAIKRSNVERELKEMYNSLVNELELASSVQLYLLPSWLKIDGQMIFSSTYKPSNKVGGDLFDFIKISETSYVTYVGDVSGHGVQAALIMTAVKSIINMLINMSTTGIEPYYIIERLNKILAGSMFRNNFLTILLCSVDLEKRSLSYFNAGHPPLIEFDISTNKARALEGKGSIPVGWQSSIEYDLSDQVEVDFNPNKIFLLYTDGIFECENQAGAQLGISGLIDLVEKESASSMNILLPHLFRQRLIDLNYDITQDDFTLTSMSMLTSEKGEGQREFFLIQSKLKNTGPVGATCWKLVNETLQDSVLAIKVEMIVNEYLNNIIEHGLELKKEAVIALEICVKQEVSLCFWDKGIDWHLPEKEGEEEIIDSDRFRGRGMQIIYSQAKSIRRKRYADINETVIIV